MPQVVKKTALELYIKAFLKTNGVRNIGRTYAKKALALIDEKLGIPCCDDPTATINLFTRFDNNFTNTVKALLLNLPKIGNTQSLKRSKTLITNAIYCCNSSAPTVGVVNDTTNTFNWTFADDFTDVTAYEYTLNGGQSYTAATVKPVVVGDITKAPGQVGVRIKEGSYNGRFYGPSDTVFNLTAFNIGVAPAAPTAPVTDDVADTFDWTNNPLFTAVGDYQFTTNGGSTYAALVGKPLNVVGAFAVGTVGVRVKAIGGNPSSATLFNAVAFT